MDAQLVPAAAVRAELITEAIHHCSRIVQSAKDIIEQKFALGRVVYAALREAHYGDGAVRRLSADISRALGKIIAPSSLYEAARLYTTFGGDIERIWALERACAFPLSYTFLVRAYVPALTREAAWNAEEWAAAHGKRLAQWERTVLDIEDQAAAVGQDADTGGTSAAPREDAREQLAGFQAACSQSQAYRTFAVRTLLRTMLRLAQRVVDRSSTLHPRDARLVEEIEACLAAIKRRLGVPDARASACPPPDGGAE